MLENDKTFYDPDGKWKIEVVDLGQGRIGFRRYHDHPNTHDYNSVAGWSPVRATMTGEGWKFECRLCDEVPPDALEGFIKLLEWER